MQELVDIIIDTSMCLESYPCQHGVTLIYSDGTSKSTKWNGVQIYHNLVQLNKSVPPHFACYATF